MEARDGTSERPWTSEGAAGSPPAVVLLALLLAPLPFFLSGCAAGVIGAIVAVLASGDDDSSGGPVGSVSSLAVASSLVVPCTDRVDADDLKGLCHLEDFVGESTVRFTFGLEISRPTRSDAHINVTASVIERDGSSVISTRRFSDLAEGFHDLRCDLPPGLLAGEYTLRVEPASGTAAEAPIVVERRREPGLDVALCGVRSLDCASGLSGTIELTCALEGADVERDIELVLVEVSPRPGLHFKVNAGIDVVEGAGCGAQGRAVVVTWDSTDPYDSESADVVALLVVRDRANPLLASVHGSCETLHIDNSAPDLGLDITVSSEPPGVNEFLNHLVGRVFIRYLALDPGSEPCDLDLSVELPGGLVLTTRDGTLTEARGAPSDGTTGLETSPAGVLHTFVWNSDRDIDRLRAFPQVGGVTIAARLQSTGSCLASLPRRRTRILNDRLMHGIVGVTPGQTLPGENRALREELTLSSLSSLATDPTGRILYFTDLGTSSLWRMGFTAEAPDVLRLVGGGAARAPDVPPVLGIASETLLSGPTDLVFDPADGALYLLEESGVLAKVLERNDIYVPLLGPEVLNRPRSLALEDVDGLRLLYVADTENCRVIRYDLSVPPSEIDDPQSAAVIFGDLLTLKPAEEPAIGAGYPGVTNGCSFLGAAAQACAPRFPRAPWGLEVYRSRTSGRRYLFISEPLNERILRLDLGSAADPLSLPVIPPEGPAVLFAQGGRACPAETIFSRPKAMRLVGDTLYVVSDGVKRNTVTRGVVVRLPLSENAAGEPVCGEAELVAGRITPDVPDRAITCGCTDSSSATYAESQECELAELVAFGNPSDFVVDAAGTLHISDQFNQRLRRLGEGGESCAQPQPDGSLVVQDGAGRLTTFFGGSAQGRLEPEAVLGLDETVVDVDGGRCAPGRITAGEQALRSKLADPRGLIFADETTLFFTDQENGRVRRLDLETGLVATVAGRQPSLEEAAACVDFAGDGGRATDSRFKDPRAVAIFPPYRPLCGGAGEFWCRPDRVVYVADAQNHRVRKIDAGGVITTFAGSGLTSHEQGICNPPLEVPADVSNESLGTAPAHPRSVYLKFPRGIVVDSRGYVFIADCRDRILMVNPEGTLLQRVAGRGRENLSLVQSEADFVGHCRRPNDYPPATDGAGLGDGGDALGAIFFEATEMVFDCEERFLYLADHDNHRVRRLAYDRTKHIGEQGVFGAVTTVAGNGTTVNALVSGSLELAVAIGINSPFGLDYDPATHALYFTCEFDHAVYRLFLDDEAPDANRIECLLGFRVRGATGDGNDPVEARLANPTALRLDANGNVIVADSRNHRLRKFFAAPR
jgi:sugar lactone lactonase YvrE